MKYTQLVKALRRRFYITTLLTLVRLLVAIYPTQPPSHKGDELRFELNAVIDLKVDRR